MTDAQKWPTRHQHSKNPDGETVIVPWSGGSWVLASDIAPLWALYEACKAVDHIHADSTESEYDLWCRWDKAMAECRKREDEHNG